jgi:hypothetical protein
MEEDVISPSVVAKVILEAVTSDNPQLRYIVGEDGQLILMLLPILIT